MPGTNEFLPIAVGDGSYVSSTASWQNSPRRLTGFQSGIVPGADFNKAFRQPSVLAAIIGAFIADQGYDARDDGDLDTLRQNFEAALQNAFSGTLPAQAAYWHFGINVGSNAASLVADVSPNVSVYAAGYAYSIRVSQASVAGGTTANFDNHGLRTVRRADGTAIQAGDWTAGQIIILIDDGAALQLVGAVSSPTQILNLILPYTPAGARYASAFTAAVALSNFPGGATGSFSGPFTQALSLTVTGASYMVIKGTCGFRPVSANGTDCRARIRTTIAGQTPVISTPYQGCRPYSNTQITVNVEIVLQNLDPTKSVLVELIVDRTENDANCIVLDPRITVQHDGNP